MAILPANNTFVKVYDISMSALIWLFANMDILHYFASEFLKHNAAKHFN